MSVQQVTQIATNNAAWCDLICRLHGRPGEFRNDLWLNLQAVPPFYPNAVTLAEDETSIQAATGTLATRLQTSTWAVKDSFGRLNLSSFGMERLFDADWIARPATLDVLASQQPEFIGAGSRLQANWTNGSVPGDRPAMFRKMPRGLESSQRRCW